MNGRRIFKTAAVGLTLALALGFNGAGATPSTSHTIVGSGTSGTYTVLALTASEASQSGSATINSLPVVIDCVSVIVSGPGLHYAEMRGIDASGLAIHLTVRQSTAGAFLIVSPTTTSTICGAGGPGVVGPGVFVIAP